MTAEPLIPKPTIALGVSTACATRQRGVIWRDQQTTRVFGQAWETPRYRPGQRLSERPTGPCLRSFTQIVEATTASCKAQLRGTTMRHASTALIARHARHQLRQDDPKLTAATAALIPPVIEAVRLRLCENWD